ncbi:MAG: bifunctional riboflavin kinase/FMN adenylyltransferase [Phycisphaerales bacterium]|nr:bifunctional riboflavin kinase/FMN adenylyltransferase [Phycisphaerales bacterium]
MWRLVFRKNALGHYPRFGAAAQAVYAHKLPIFLSSLDVGSKLVTLLRLRCITIGNFDGVHVGHQALLERARVLAGSGGQVVAVTFDPHPAMLLKPELAPPTVQTLQERRECLVKYGADQVHVINTTKELLAMSAEQFMAWLRAQIAFDCIVEGPDFHFGKDRAGDINTLRAIGLKNDFPVDQVASVEVALSDASRAVASSSLLRWLLQHGRVHDVAAVLGRAYQLTGVVQKGDQRGRTLGWPTANIATGARVLPSDGIYAGLATLPTGARKRAAISIGTKPTFGSHARTVEAFLLDHKAPLDDYGWTLTLEFSRWLRGQTRFDGVQALLEQMNLDTQRTRQEIAQEVVLT